MQIETERLILRDFRDDDWPDMLAYWVDPRYQRHYAEVADPEEMVRGLVGWFVAQQIERPRRKWQLAVTLKDDGRFVGNCGVRITDPELREGDIGYELHPDYWGRGYATEAARAVLRFGFEQAGLHRVWAECVADNVGSQRVLEKLGLRREARFREHRWYKGRWWDTLIYAMLEHEWNALSSRDCAAVAITRAARHRPTPS
jgi:RimJ/RimL family protein N-acetyltransferase